MAIEMHGGGSSRNLVEVRRGERRDGADAQARSNDGGANVAEHPEFDGIEGAELLNGKDRGTVALVAVRVAYIKRMLNLRQDTLSLVDGLNRVLVNSQDGGFLRIRAGLQGSHYVGDGMKLAFYFRSR